jgi:hypothetical protein
LSVLGSDATCRCQLSVLGSDTTPRAQGGYCTRMLPLMPAWSVQL